ncbi:MAG: thioredoxin-dependent thiol peroxidase [Actinomycetaceae bacterium]|nr:thioredoxin-dependent thiol peroxidase [Actinomycetaceae bacterium]
MSKLAAGDVAPDFTLATAEGQVSLTEMLAACDKGVIVYFFPRAMTPGCTTQACDFRDSYASLKDAGYLVLGISGDAPDKLAQFAQRDSLGFPLASDPEREVMEAYGAFGEKKNYGKLVKGVIRSTFVIGKDGRIEHAMYSVRAKGHVQRLRRELGLD